MHGETLHDIVAEYRLMARDEDRRALQSDFERCLSESQGDVEAGLTAEFDLDIIPSAFAADGEDFVRSICRLLDAPEQGRPS